MPEAIDAKPESIFSRMARLSANPGRRPPVAPLRPQPSAPHVAAQQTAAAPVRPVAATPAPTAAPLEQPTPSKSSIFSRLARLAPADEDAPPTGDALDGGEDDTPALQHQLPPARAAASPAIGGGGSSSALFARMSALTRLATPAPTAAPARPTEKVTALVERTQIYSGTWGVAYTWTDDRKSLKVTGDIVAELKDGLKYEFEGEYKTHPTYGESLAAVGANPVVEADRKSIARFISRSFKGVGETKAEQFLTKAVEAGEAEGKSEAEVLDGIRQTLVTSPWTLDVSSVAKRGQYDGEQNLMMVEAVKRDLSTRIGAFEGVKDGLLKSLASWLLTTYRLEDPASNRDGEAKNVVSPDLVDKCWARLVRDPYEPIGEVDGWGFKTADAVGRALNIPRDDPRRLAALSSYALKTACTSGGHMFLTSEQAVDAIRAVDATLDTAKALAAGVEKKFVERVVTGRGTGREVELFYDADLYDVEMSLARQLVRMMRKPAKPLSKEPAGKLREKLQSIAKRLNPNLANGLDDSQLDALVGILTSRTRVHTITAGPGCGKTSMMEVLTAYLGAEEFDYCAPTGRAALVLSNRLREVGGSATTIHSLYKGAGRNDFKVNADEPLESHVLVVDEGSMPPASIWDGVLAGMNREQHLIILGDVRFRDKDGVERGGQLPSIEPGQVLQDLLKIPAADHHRLTASHRAAGGLLDVLYQIDRSTVDCVDRDDIKFSHGLPPAEVGFAAVAQEYMEAVGEHGYAQTALLMSRRKGQADKPDWNVTYANARLREMCNPNAPKVPGTRFHLNDRVIFRENLMVFRGTVDPIKEAASEKDGPADDYADAGKKVRVVNGDTGTITDFVKGNGSLAGAKYVRVKLDDGRDVHYPMESAIDHSYAITVHSAQGGEYSRVLSVVTPGHASFVNQVMLRTQLSRARRYQTVWADDAVLKRVAATPMPGRNSRLVELVDALLKAPVPSDEVDEDANEDEVADEGQHERCRA